MSVEQVDVLVIGGGIQGVGVAQAASAAGHSVLLIERKALASGTSSRSSKLIHGGLRYLESAQFSLVRESLRERRILLQIAPELVRLVPFFIPIYRDTSRGPMTIRAGLSLYALLGGLDRTARFRSVPRRDWGELDGLRTDGLRAVFRYHDAQTDDAALVRAVAHSAVKLGARIESPASLVHATRTDSGYRARYRNGSGEHELECAAMVNAAGPWINDVQALIEPRPPRMDLDLVQGTHVEVPGELKRGIYYAEAPSDRRAVFLMPWKGHTLVGTTELLHDGPADDAGPTEREIEYLLETLRHHLPDHPGASAEPLDAWAGLRVLPKGDGRAFDRPRDVTLVTDDERSPRLVSIYGGKLTGYRSTAVKVMKRIAAALPPATARGDTAEIRLEPSPTS